MNWSGFVEAVLACYLLPGALLAAFLEQDDVDDPLARWVIEWPGCIYREVTQQ